MASRRQRFPRLAAQRGLPEPILAPTSSQGDMGVHAGDEHHADPLQDQGDDQGAVGAHQPGELSGAARVARGIEQRDGEGRR